MLEKKERKKELKCWERKKERKNLNVGKERT